MALREIGTMYDEGMLDGDCPLEGFLRVAAVTTDNEAFEFETHFLTNANVLEAGKWACSYKGEAVVDPPSFNAPHISQGGVDEARAEMNEMARATLVAWLEGR